MFLGHLVDRAAHIDVDQISAMIDSPACCVGKRIRLIAIELH